MSAAVRAKDAKARAAIAARMIKTIKPWPQGWGLGCNRGFDDCFEMNDGDQVVKHLKLMALRDPKLREGMRVHKEQVGHWLEEVEAILAQPQMASLFPLD